MAKILHHEDHFDIYDAFIVEEKPLSFVISTPSGKLRVRDCLGNDTSVTKSVSGMVFGITDTNIHAAHIRIQISSYYRVVEPFPSRKLTLDQTIIRLYYSNETLSLEIMEAEIAGGYELTIRNLRCGPCCVVRYPVSWFYRMVDALEGRDRSLDLTRSLDLGAFVLKLARSSPTVSSQIIEESPSYGWKIVKNQH